MSHDGESNVGIKLESEINAAIRLVGEARFGVVDTDFLCQSISILQPHKPHCVKQEDTLAVAVASLQRHKVGCVLVVDPYGKLVGLLSERDIVLKVMGEGRDISTIPVTDIMTRDPIAEAPSVSIAYALNLMSHGGFRHLPLIDDQRIPVGMISVKDVIDFIVTSYTEALLGFEIPEV